MVHDQPINVLRITQSDQGRLHPYKFLIGRAKPDWYVDVNNFRLIGAAALLPPACAYRIEIEYSLKTFDACNHAIEAGGTPSYGNYALDCFSATMTQKSYADLLGESNAAWYESEFTSPALLRPTPMGMEVGNADGLLFMWGGQKSGYWQELEETAGSQSLTVSAHGTTTNYLNVVMDSVGMPEGYLMSSWGTVTGKRITEIDQP